MADGVKNAWVEFKSDDDAATVTLPQEDGGTVPVVSQAHKPGSVVARINVASQEQRTPSKRSNSIHSGGNSGRGARVAPREVVDPKTTTTIDMSGGVAAPSHNVDTKTLKTGKLLTTVFPTNMHCAWLSMPAYDATNIPKILSHEQIGLSPDAFTEVMRSITGDIRFISYCALFSRVLPVWVMTSIVVLLIVLFSASTNGGFPVMFLAFVWVLMLLMGITFGIIIRKHLTIALRQCVKDANRSTLSKNLLLGVQDRGQLSCHKVAILFIYYEVAECRKDIARLLQVHEVSSVNAVVSDTIRELKTTAQISPDENSGRLTDDRASQLADQMILDYIQQYVKAYIKKQLLFPTRPLEGVSDFRPKHCAKSHCLCQFVEKDFFGRTRRRTWFEKLR